MKSCAPSTYCFAFRNSGNSAPCFCQCPKAFSTDDLLGVADQMGDLLGTSEAPAPAVAKLTPAAPSRIMPAFAGPRIIIALFVPSPRLCAVSGSAPASSANPSTAADVTVC